MTTLLRRRRWVLLASLVLLAVFGLVGGGVSSQLKGGGFDDPNSTSARAQQVLGQRFGAHDSNLTLLVRAKSGLLVDAPAVAALGRATAQRLAGEPGITVQASYWTSEGPTAAALRSRDGQEALIVAYVAGSDDDARATGKAIGKSYRTDTATAEVVPGGFVVANNDITSQVIKDLAVAEGIAIPLTLVLLVLAFGGVVAGLLPLMVGGTSILGTFFVLSLLCHVTDVSIFALNLTTAMGLGLGIDYSLLIVSRFREELARGLSPIDAAMNTLRTAGRTVAFSAATVAVALSALLVFPLYFLRSFAYAGIAVVIVSALGALVLLPAVLVMLGKNVNRLAFPWVRRGQESGGQSAFWAATAKFVMRRPVLVAIPVTALLLTMAIPFLHVKWGLPDDRVLATQASSRTVGDAIRDDFDSLGSANLSIVVTGVGPVDRENRIESYAVKLSQVTDVSVVQAETGVYQAGKRVAAAPGRMAAGDATRLVVTPTVSPYSDPARTLVHSLRDVPAPGQQLVGGDAASLVDTLHSVGSALPWAVAIIVIASLVILFLFTGSVLLPVKALLMNVISLASVMGVIVWIFQYGHGSSTLNFIPQPLSISMPLLLFCVAFGLSMDYEVFLLGRIKEQHDLGDDTNTAVEVGLARTGRIVTTAAALLAVTFLAFVSSKVSFIQLFGLGTGLAIIVDATLVRGVLVPAFMRLVGEANWWAPAPLRRLHAKIGFAEGPMAAPPSTRPEEAPATA